MLRPLFLLFAPGVHDRLDRVVAAFGRNDDRKPELAIVVVVALGAVVASGAVPGLGWLPTWVVAYPLWLAIGGGVCVVAVQALAADRWSTTDGGRTTTAAGPHGGPGVRVAAVVILVVGVLNGLGPYLEYRTAAAFNMYANLHIADGRSNHLLIPPLRSGPSGLLAVVAVDAGGGGEPTSASPLRYYVDNGLALPEANLHRYLVANPNENPLVAPTSDGGSGAVAARSLGLGTETPGGLRGWLGELAASKLGFRRAEPVTTPATCLRTWGPLG